MAERLTPESARNGATAQHNIANINEAVLDGFRKRLSLEQQIAALKETHIKPLMDDLKGVVKEQKKTTDIDGEDLKVFYAVFKRQQDAKGFVEDGDRDRVLDNMRVIFEAMAQGGQLDFVDAMSAPEQDAESDSEETGHAPLSGGGLSTVTVRPEPGQEAA